MGRIWRNEAGIVLRAYFIACVAGLGCAALGHPGPRAQQTPLAQQAPWLLLTAFLTWRVWRRGRISRAFLILAAIGEFVKFAHLGPAGWNPSVLGLLAIYAAQLALLLSLFLASMDWGALPGCGLAGAALAQLPGRCFGLQEGLPLRFLSAYQGVPEIGKRALVEDWALWSLVSFSVLYLLRLQFRRPEYAPAPTEQPSTV